MKKGRATRVNALQITTIPATAELRAGMVDSMMADTVSADYVASMRLSDHDSSLLAGESGDGSRLAMELLVAAGAAMGAESLLDISGAHIDSCLYHGQAGLDFAVRLADADARVAVPTTLNVSSLDLLHPDLYRGDEDTRRAARSQMDAYERMGCRPTWTCAPYQLVERPRAGEQVAWGESNAIVFANSVLAARTERYGDFLDICCAITGRAPAVGLHTNAGRRARFELKVEVPDAWHDNELLYVAIGHLLGQVAGTRVGLITGLDMRATEDRLKALGAAAASSGAVAMFHVDGVTPESGVTDHQIEETVRVDADEIGSALSTLGSSSGPLTAISIGTPHASADELRALARLCAGRKTRLPFYVNTGRDVLSSVGDAASAIETFGATIVTDTCTYITPIMGDTTGTVMTNSGKWAYYAPANLGLEVVMGTLEDCVESAVVGTTVTERGFG